MSTPTRSPRSYRRRPLFSLLTALALVPLSVFATEAGRVDIGPAQVAWPDLLDHGGASLVLDELRSPALSGVAAHGVHGEAELF